MVSVSVALPEWFFSNDRAAGPVILLTLLVSVLLTLNHWLLETLTGWGESLLELRLLPWLALGVGAWLLAGRSD